METKYIMKNINNNRYITTLSNFNNVPIQNFLKSQECFISAVDHWSKVLGLLLTKLPSPKERLVIVQNLYDEHGQGNIEKSHVNTFISLLKSLNYDKEIKLYNEELESYSIIKKFNESLVNAINNESWTYSVAMLAMIEYVYIDISRNIHNYLKNFLKDSKINHYELHEIVDEGHYKDLLQLLDGVDAEDIDKGFEYGYELMDNMYHDLSYFL